MTGANVLIAEADKPVAQELKGIIESLGYKVVGIVSSSEEAIRTTQTLGPNIVLMDMRLKGRISITHTGSLIHDQFDVPVVYITGHTSESTIRRVGGTGSFGYIFKPFNERHILATIETALIRHLMEKRLEEGRQWLNTILTSIGDGVIACDEHGRVRFINPVAMKLTGWQAEAVGKKYNEVFIFLDEATHEPMELDALQKSKHYDDPGVNIEGLLSSRNGLYTPLELNINPIYDGEKRKRGTVLAFRDISMQREALHEIKRQANRAEALMKVTSQINKQLELETLLIKICEITSQSLKAAGTSIFLLDSNKNVFTNLAGHISDPSLDNYKGLRFDIPRNLFESLFYQQNPVLVISDLQPFATLSFWKQDIREKIKIMVVAALFRKEQLIGTLISIFLGDQKSIPMDDIKLLEGLAGQASNAIENAELFRQVRIGRERQKKLSKGLVEVQEAERRHIARELHDHLGQTLTGLQFMLETTKGQVDDAPKKQLEDIQGYVAYVIGQVREMSLNLRPSMLDDIGLLPTLQWHFERFTNQTGIKVNFKSDSFTERFPTEIEIAAYRIIQEALTNIARYANVKEAFVGLARQGSTLWIDVLDNGKGFDPSTDLDTPTSGLGGMRERAEIAGGYLTVKSYPNQGTQIFATLPLDKKNLERRKSDRFNSPR